MKTRDLIINCRNAFRLQQALHESNLEKTLSKDIRENTDDISQNIKYNKEMADLCDKELEKGNSEIETLKIHKDVYAKACEYLSRLLTKYIKPKVPNWEPLENDLMGLITQLDNMLTGMQWKEPDHINKEYNEYAVEIHGQYFGFNIPIGMGQWDCFRLSESVDMKGFAGILYKDCPCNQLVKSNMNKFLMNAPQPCDKHGPFTPVKVRMMK